MIDPRVEMLLSHGLPDRTTKRYRNAIENSVAMTTKADSKIIDAYHLLAGLMSERNGIAYNVMKNLGFKMDAMIEHLESIPRTPTITDMEISHDASVAVRESVDWMRKHGHSHLDTEHLLLALIENELIKSFLAGCDVHSGDILHEIRGLHGLLS